MPVPVPVAAPAPPQLVRPAKAAPAVPPAATLLVELLNDRRSVRAAVLLHEVLGLPLCRRRQMGHDFNRDGATVSRLDS
jgi:hypothetical protein